LEDLGLVETWEVPGGPPVVILSTAGAARLGLELSDGGNGTGVVWVPTAAAAPDFTWTAAGTFDPGAAPARGRSEVKAARETDLCPPPAHGNGHAAGLDGLADPEAVDPAEAAARADADHAARRRLYGRAPTPCVFLGVARPWPYPWPDATPCPACH